MSNEHLVPELQALVANAQTEAKALASGDLASMAEDYDLEGAEDYEILDAWREGLLSVESELKVSVITGTGGPHIEYTFMVDIGDFQPHGGEINAYWGGKHERGYLSESEYQAVWDAVGIESDMDVA